jgi:hypothetical protein
MSLAMRPIVIAKLLDLTLFGLYLALGFTHSAGDGAASKTCARPPEQPTRSERWSSAHALGAALALSAPYPRGRGTPDRKHPVLQGSAKNHSAAELALRFSLAPSTSSMGRPM